MPQPLYRVHLTRNQPLVKNQTNIKSELRRIYSLLKEYLDKHPCKEIRIELSPNYEKEIKATGFHGFGLAEASVMIDTLQTKIETIDIAFVKEDGNPNFKFILMPAHPMEHYDTEKDPYGFERKTALEHITKALFTITESDVSVCLSDADKGPESNDDALKNWLRFSKHTMVRNVFLSHINCKGSQVITFDGFTSISK